MAGIYFLNGVSPTFPSVCKVRWSWEVGISPIRYRIRIVSDQFPLDTYGYYIPFWSYLASSFLLPSIHPLGRPGYNDNYQSGSIRLVNKSESNCWCCGIGRMQFNLAFRAQQNDVTNLPHCRSYTLNVNFEIRRLIRKIDSIINHRKL